MMMQIYKQSKELFPSKEMTY